MLLFATGNVNHMLTIDGEGTFHGMGMIAAVNPGSQVSYTVLKEKMFELHIKNKTKISIK